MAEQKSFSERLRDWRTGKGYQLSHASSQLRKATGMEITTERLKQLESGHFEPTQDEAEWLLYVMERG